MSLLRCLDYLDLCDTVGTGLPDPSAVSSYDNTSVDWVYTGPMDNNNSHLQGVCYVLAASLS